MHRQGNQASGGREDCVCRDQLTRNVAAAERQAAEMARRPASPREDDECRKRAEANSKTAVAHDKARIEGLARCDQEANELLAQQCKEVETAFRFSTQE